MCISSHIIHQICGSWTDVPAIYTRYLERGKLHIVVTSESRPQGEISGLARAQTSAPSGE